MNSQYAIRNTHHAIRNTQYAIRTKEPFVKLTARIVAIALLLLALTSCAGATSQTVARVGDITLTRQELDLRISRIEQGFSAQAAQGAAVPTRLDIERDIVERFIDQYLVLDIARERGIVVSDEEVNTQIADFRVQIPQATGGTLDDAVKNQLGLPGETSSEFRQFVMFIVAQQKLVDSLVPEDAVRARITDEVMVQTQEMVQKADVAHILVATEEEARAVLARLDAGEEFGALAAELSTDPGSAQNGGVYEGIGPGEFVPEFDEYMFGRLQPGETTTEPVQTQFGYHIIRLIALNTVPAVSEADAAQIIDQRVAEEVQFERQTAYQQLIDDERAQGIQERTIEQPTFPTPTPDPAFEQAPVAPAP
jgi:parvulin-like peptidyl-prolyl isomerase